MHTLSFICTHVSTCVHTHRNLDADLLEFRLLYIECLSLAFHVYFSNVLKAFTQKKVLSASIGCDDGENHGISSPPFSSPFLTSVSLTRNQAL